MRLLRLASRSLRRLDHRLGRVLGGVRVLVDVRTPMNLAVLAPVWERLLADPRIDVRFSAREADAVGETLGPALRSRLVRAERAIWMRFDLALTADLWNDVPVRRCARRINFFHGVAGKYDLDSPQRLAAAGLERFDRLAFVNDDRRQRYVESGAITAAQAVLVGFPKLDALLGGRWDARSVRAELALDPHVATVLYAPTFSTANSLHLAGEALIETLLRSGRNVVVKLHDRTMVPTAKYTDGIDWPSRLRRFDEHPRFALARGADAAPYLAAADVLVTDHSTVGFEFAMLDRPIVVFDAPRLKQEARIDDDKWMLLRSMADVVNTLDGLRAAVDAAFEDPGRLHGARAAAQRLFAYPGTAADRAMTVVYELLELEPRATTVVRAQPTAPVAENAAAGASLLARPHRGSR